ncbi:MAG: DUF2341 domain-containing protein, partial [Nanopusillaceae archaeon]
FPETPISYGDNYYNTYDPWTCDYCNMYIRVYLKYYSSDGTGPKDAIIKIESDDDQVVWVNGKLVGYGPIGTKVYDIASYIVPGDNEIWIMCKEYWGDEYCFFDLIIDGIYINRDGIYSREVEKIFEEGSLIWVRIPRIAARNNHTIYMYFGSDHYILGDPYKIFDIYEDFRLKPILTNWDVYVRQDVYRMPPYTVEIRENSLRVYVLNYYWERGYVSVAHKKEIYPCNKKIEYSARFLSNYPVRAYFIGFSEQPTFLQNAIGFFSSDWYPENSTTTGEKLFSRLYDLVFPTRPLEIRDILGSSLVYTDTAVKYLPDSILLDAKYLIDIVTTGKIVKSTWYVWSAIKGTAGFYSEAKMDKRVIKCSIPTRLIIYVGPVTEGNIAEIYLDWIRVYNYYEPEPIAYQLSIEENPKYVPTEGETYEETVLEYIQQQEQQAQQPPTYQPPTQQPPTYQPPIYQPPIYIPPEYQPIMEYPGEQIIVQQPTPQPTPGVQTVIEYVTRQPILLIVILILIIAILLAITRK